LIAKKFLTREALLQIEQFMLLCGGEMYGLRIHRTVTEEE
jgi:hypothetical protein